MRTRNFSRLLLPISPPGWAALSRSAAACRNPLVNEGGGARTPLSGALAAGIILVVVLFFSHLLAALPQPVLAAVVLVAVTGLFKVSTLRHLRHTNRTEYHRGRSRVGGRAQFGPAARRDDRRGHLAGAFDPARVAAARRLARPHPRDPALLRSRATSGQRVDSRRLDFPARSRASSISTWITCATRSWSGCAPRRRRPSSSSSTSPPRRYVDMHSAHMLDELADELKRRACACRWSKRARRCATGCERKAWMNVWAGSTGSPPWPTPWTAFKKREPGPGVNRSERCPALIDRHGRSLFDLARHLARQSRQGGASALPKAARARPAGVFRERGA